MFCVDMAPCWRRPCHVLALGVGEGGIVLARGVVRTLLPTGTVLESTEGVFLRIRSDFEAKWELAGPREDQL